jgi:hypothetical protein
MILQPTRGMPMSSRQFLGCLLILLAAITPVRAQSKMSPEKDKLIRRVLEVTGAQKTMVQVSSQLIGSFKQSQPNVPEEFWNRLEKKFGSQDLLEHLIPIYDKYYSEQDLIGLLAFYESPLGQKVLSTMPQVMQESMQVGQAWGKQKAEEVLRELKEYQSQNKK